jgi:hypothetical protein
LERTLGSLLGEHINLSSDPDCDYSVAGSANLEPSAASASTPVTAKADIRSKENATPGSFDLDAYLAHLCSGDHNDAENPEGESASDWTAARGTMQERLDAVEAGLADISVGPVASEKQGEEEQKGDVEEEEEDIEALRDELRHRWGGAATGMRADYKADTAAAEADSLLADLSPDVFGAETRPKPAPPANDHPALRDPVKLKSILKSASAYSRPPIQAPSSTAPQTPPASAKPNPSPSLDHGAKEVHAEEPAPAPVPPSQMSFSAFHRMLTDARIKCSRTLLNTLDKE